MGLIGHGQKLEPEERLLRLYSLAGLCSGDGNEECEGGFCPGDNAAATVARVIPPSFPPKCCCLTFKFTVSSSQLLCVEEDDGQ